MHSPIPASKQYLHVERLLRDYIVRSVAISNYNVTSVRILSCVRPKEMALALRAADRLGCWHPIHTGAGVVPSMLRNRLSLEKSVYDK